MGLTGVCLDSSLSSALHSILSIVVNSFFSISYVILLSVNLLLSVHVV